MMRALRFVGVAIVSLATCRSIVTTTAVASESSDSRKVSSDGGSSSKHTTVVKTRRRNKAMEESAVPNENGAVPNENGAVPNENGAATLIDSNEHGSEFKGISDERAQAETVNYEVYADGSSVVYEDYEEGEQVDYVEEEMLTPEQRQRMEDLEREHVRMLEGVQSIVKEYRSKVEDWEGTSKQVDELTAKLLEEQKELDQKYEELMERTQRLNQQVRRYNVHQLKVFAARLHSNLQEEMDRRSKWNQQELQRKETARLLKQRLREEFAAAKAARAEAAANATQNEEDIVEVTWGDLQQELSLALLVSESNQELLEFVEEMVEYQLEDSMEMDRREVSKRVQAVLSSDAFLQRQRACPAPHEVVASIEETLLLETTSPRHDHAASIVYEMTSDTFEPPLETFRLGAFSTYIPEDIERMLPDGWHDWLVPSSHEVWKAMGLSREPSINAADVILTPTTASVGSCWPMAGSKGFVTVEFPYDLKVDTITVEHVPAVLLTPSKVHNSDVSSAPRALHVVGYPACAPTEESCRFDVEAGVPLGRFEYTPVGIFPDAPRRSRQSFTLGITTDEEEGVDDGNDEEQEGVGGCSGGADPVEGEPNDPLSGGGGTMCSGPPEDEPVTTAAVEVPTIRALRFFIDSNWGHDEYTCLYRVRFHGTAMNA